MLIPILAFLIVYLMFRVTLSFHLFRAFEYVLKDATQFNIRDHREYRVWVGENPKEFFYAAGLPVMMIFIYLISQAISRWKSALGSIRNGQREIIVLFSLLLTLCAVVLLGVNRGETTSLEEVNSAWLDTFHTGGDPHIPGGI